MSTNKKNMVKYEWRERNKFLGYGITNDIERRKAEHKSEIPGSHLEPVGSKCTETGAREWGREKLRNYRKRHGELPPMNKPRNSWG